MPGTIARAILSFTESKIVILLLINVLLLIVGTFMEALAAIVILTPILLPVVTGVGVSPLHFGVIIVINLAIGFVTPPVGVNLFVASGVAKAKLEKIAGMALPMIGPDAAGSAALHLLPAGTALSCGRQVSKVYPGRPGTAFKIINKTAQETVV